jgi:hypothetical protein
MADSYNSYVGDGSTLAYQYTFDLPHSATIQVLIGGVTQTTGYTINSVTKSVVFSVAPALGASILLLRVSNLDYLNIFGQGAAFTGQNLDENFQLLANIAGESSDTSDRVSQLAIRVSATEGSIAEVPSLAARKGKLFGWHGSTGAPIAVDPESGSASDVLLTLSQPTGATLVGAVYGGNNGNVQQALDSKLSASSFSGSGAERGIGRVASIAQLRLTEPTADNQIVTVVSHTAGTGYGGGQFISKMVGTGYTDNNGTVIKTTANGRVWLRLNADVVNPLMFGAVPRVDDTTPSAHTAINAAVVASAGRCFTGLGYTYNVTGELAFNNTLPTEHKDIVINAITAAAVGNIIRVNNAAHFIHHIRIEGNNTDLAIGINQANTAPGTIIQNCTINNCGRTAIFSAGNNCKVLWNRTDNCGYAGTGNYRCSIQMNECVHSVMEHNICTDCVWGILTRNEIGVTVGYYNRMSNNIVLGKTGITADCQGCSAAAQRHLTTSGNIIRNFPNNGIDHQNCFELTIVNNHVDACADGVFIGDRSTGRNVISGNVITGCKTGVRYYNPSTSTFTGQSFQDVVIANNVIHAPSLYCIWVTMSQTANSNRTINISGNICDGQATGTLGIVLDTVQFGTVAQNHVYRVNGHGISCVSCESLSVIGNNIIDAGLGTTNTYDAINFTNCSRCSAIGNHGTGSSMRYVVVIGSGGYNMAHMNQSRSMSGATAVTISGSAASVESLNLKS